MSTGRHYIITDENISAHFARNMTLMRIALLSIICIMFKSTSYLCWITIREVHQLKPLQAETLSTKIECIPARVFKARI